MNEEFDWNRDQECVVVPQQWKIAVYENSAGNVVIQQASSFDDEDDVVVVAKAHVLTLCRALCEAASVTLPATPVVLPAPPRSSGAERSKRYRERRAQREGCDARDAEIVTCDASHGLTSQPTLPEAAE